MSKQNSPRIYDTHAHVQFSAYHDDAQKIIEEDLAHGVWMNLIGTQVDTSRAAVATAERYDEGVYATVGLHPTHLTPVWHDVQELGGGEGFKSRQEKFDSEFYRSLAQSKKVVGIGEMGLDYYRIEEVVTKSGEAISAIKQRQHEAFAQGIDLAAELDKAIVVHCRAAHGDLRQLLRAKKIQHPNLRGVIHSFSDGTWDDAQEYLSLGFYIAFNGIVTFPARKSAGVEHAELQRVVREVPFDRLLLETDAPYLTPPPHRGERNRPSYTELVARYVALVRRQTAEQVCAQTTANARALFLV